MPRTSLKLLILPAIASSACILAIVLVSAPILGKSGLGPALDPVSGFYAGARSADHIPEVLHFDALDDTVRVVYNDRGVPQILAKTDHDAIMTLGYVVARDRLFQLDFLPRVASGHLGEVLGESAVATDRYLRSTGMELGAKKNLARIELESTIEEDLIRWYAAGVNAHIRSIDHDEWPLEFRLLGYSPKAFLPIDALRVLQYMNYDLSFRAPDEKLARFVEADKQSEFKKLYPTVSPFSVPIVPSIEDDFAYGDDRRTVDSNGRETEIPWNLAERRPGSTDDPVAADQLPWPGFVEGKGSNNWAVSGRRSGSGKPILAGDMHLSLSLPAIWYEVGIHTPTMSLYGVTIPGAPAIVEGFNDSIAWAYTNSGADVVDRYSLAVDSLGTSYFFDGAWRAMQVDLDTIRVRDAESLIDTVKFTHHGPVSTYRGRPVATRWVGHEQNRILKALWSMNHAHTREDFILATEGWDSPMQNILFADRLGNVELRATGYMPLRGQLSGEGVLDGTTSRTDWVGRIPFDELPHVDASLEGFVTSTNQRPVGTNYPYYLGYSWRSVFRSNRIDELLSTEDRHTVKTFKSFQADVHSVQAELLIPLLAGLELSETAEAAARELKFWDLRMSVESTQAVLFDTWLVNLERATWDEGIFDGIETPHVSQLIFLATHDPNSRWFDQPSSDQVETAREILTDSFEAAVRAGDRKVVQSDRIEWGDVHQVVFRHLTQSDQLRPLWRGPLPYPGYAETLSPGAGYRVVHSASWRMIVDFETDPVTAFGIFPGGQSGNPFSVHYDNAIAPYVAFDYFPINRLSSVAGVSSQHTITTLLPKR